MDNRDYYSSLFFELLGKSHKDYQYETSYKANCKKQFLLLIIRVIF